MNHFIDIGMMRKEERMNIGVPTDVHWSEVHWG